MQTVVTLARGCDITAPVLFCGGPLTFIPALRKAFADYLNLSLEKDFVLPEKGNLIPAWGAALAMTPHDISLSALLRLLETRLGNISCSGSSLPPIFKDQSEYSRWKERLVRYGIQRAELKARVQQVVIGIDSGSTTTKIVVLDADDRMVYSYYHDNNGNPIKAVEDGLRELYEECQRK